MGTIVYQERNGVKYAYESVSYWNAEKKAPRSKRRYLGKVDPETGQIVRARGQKKEEETNTDSREEVIEQLREQLREQLKEQEARIRDLQGQLEEARAKYRQAADTVLAIQKLAGSFRA